MLTTNVDHQFQRAGFDKKRLFYTQGEYRIADGAWQPILPNAHIPSTSGDVTLRGSFWLETPEGELLCPLPKDTPIALYFDHIGGEILMDGKRVHIFDAENPDFGVDACGEQWLLYIFEGEEADNVVIVLKNPHRFGSLNAVDEFLASVGSYTVIGFENRMRLPGSAERIIGFAVFIIAILILGMAVFSSFCVSRRAVFCGRSGLRCCLPAAI